MADDIVIRAATLDDAPGIAKVHVSSWQATYRGLLPQAFIDARTYQQRLTFWQRALGEGSEVLLCVATDDDEVIGFAAAGPARGDNLACAGELYALYLLPERQRQGIGRKLFLAIRAALKNQGHQSLMLWVLAGNPARYFYQRLGGQMIAERSERFGPKIVREIAFGWDVP